MADPTQDALFDVPPDWTALWKGMPQFAQADITARQHLTVNFRSVDDRVTFGKLIGQPVTDRTKSLWYPKLEIPSFGDTFFTADTSIGPKYPIYIVSKGRADKQLTSLSLSSMKVPHFVVVEAKEQEAYKAKAYPLATVIVLDPAYQERYDTFDELGSSKSKGPGAARNFAWEHSILLGAQWHWVMDDNIDYFYYYTDNLKLKTDSGSIFRAMEDFCGRYENIVMAGPQYYMFVIRKDKLPPFVLNTRIYSCNLIRNDLPYRWRGRYNEDTDLSLRILVDGLCTIQFNVFLQKKQPTQTMGGGNTADFYATEGTKPKSEILVKMHPTLARMVFKFGRWHHFVNYRQFTQKPLLKAGMVIPDSDQYGIYLHKPAQTPQIALAEPEPVKRLESTPRAPEPLKQDENEPAPVLVEPIRKPSTVTYEQPDLFASEPIRVSYD